MARLAEPLPTQSTQLAAIAWLRGRLFLNSFRRKGAKAEVVASILLFLFFAVFGLGPIFAAGAGAYLIVLRNELNYLHLFFWAVFFVWATFTISTKAAAPTFDLNLLIRFPLRFRTYLLVRLLFGLLDVPTVVCSFALLAATTGAGIARPTVLPAAALTFLLFDLTLMIFFRMIFLWLDRWFAQRKTREILMGCFFVAMLAFQYLNLTFNSGAENRRQRRDPIARARHDQRVNRLRHAVETAAPVLHALPPGLAATSLTRFATGQSANAVFPLIGLSAFAVAFLALFGSRLRGEFNGESFSEVSTNAKTTTPSPTQHLSASSPYTQGFFAVTIRACLTKEMLYLRRSGPLLFALVTPIFMVFLLVTRLGITQRPSEWVLPGAIAYILLGLTAGMYNILGTEGAGVQLYFLAPVQLRQIVLAKNLMSLAIITAEVAVASAIVLSTMPAPPLPTLCAVYVWVILTVAVSLTMGNIRSIYAPRLIDLGKFRHGNKGQVNALIGLGVLVLCLALGAGTLYLAHHIHQPWLPAPILALFAAGAITFYRLNLDHLAQIAQDRRETISAELCRN